MPVLDGLKWKPTWVSQLGCIKGCLDYLGVDVSEPWLFGLSGHAFVINVHPELCPSGPTAWRTERMVELCEHVGCTIRRVTGHRSEDSFGQIWKSEAYQEARRQARALPVTGRPVPACECFEACSHVVVNVEVYRKLCGERGLRSVL